MFISFLLSTSMRIIFWLIGGAAARIKLSPNAMITDPRPPKCPMCTWRRVDTCAHAPKSSKLPTIALLASGPKKNKSGRKIRLFRLLMRRIRTVDIKRHFMSPLWILPWISDYTVGSKRSRHLDVVYQNAGLHVFTRLAIIHSHRDRAEKSHNKAPRVISAEI